MFLSNGFARGHYHPSRWSIPTYVRNVKLSLWSIQNIELKRDPVYSCSKLVDFTSSANQSPAHTPASYSACVWRGRENVCSPGCFNGTVISLEQIVWQAGGFAASPGILWALLLEVRAEWNDRGGSEEFCLARIKLEPRFLKLGS